MREYAQRNIFHQFIKKKYSHLILYQTRKMVIMKKPCFENIDYFWIVTFFPSFLYLITPFFLVKTKSVKQHLQDNISKITIIHQSRGEIAFPLNLDLDLLLPQDLEEHIQQ